MDSLDSLVLSIVPQARTDSELRRELIATCRDILTRSVKEAKAQWRLPSYK